jgi:hypothetical protein
MRILYLNDHGLMTTVNPTEGYDGACTACKALSESGIIRELDRVYRAASVPVDFVDAEIGEYASYPDLVNGRIIPQKLYSSPVFQRIVKRRGGKDGLATPMFQIVHPDGSFREVSANEILSGRERRPDVFEENIRYRPWRGTRILMRRFFRCYVEEQNFPRTARKQAMNLVPELQRGEFQRGKWIDAHAKVQQLART